MKKRLNLKELELQLPAIDERNSKILLGGSDYAILDECAGVQCGCELPKDRVLTNEHNDYGDNFDLDASIDGYHDYDGSNDADGGGSSGGTGTPYIAGSFMSNLPSSFNDSGVNVADYPVSGGMALGDMNTQFIEQFYTILETNTTIGGYLQNLSNQGFSFNFNIGQIINPIPGDHTNAATSLSPTTNTINIQFNIDQMNPTDGWSDTSNNSNALKSLAETIMHELIHANYLIEFEKAKENIINNGLIPTNLNVHNALASLHGIDFAQMFFTYNPTTNQFEYISDETQQNLLQHTYMNSHGADSMFEAAKLELQNDIVQLQQHVNDLQAMLAQAAANLGSGVDPTGGGSGPTNAQLQNIYENLQHELAELLTNYGWMLP